MRVVIIGASPLALHTTEVLIESGHQVLIIEKDKERIEQLSEHLDCAFLHGDGSQPDMLREADPPKAEVLMCLTNHDQTNIIAGLVARNLGYERVITVIEQEDFEDLCEELGLTETFIPLRNISHQLAELTSGYAVQARRGTARTVTGKQRSHAGTAGAARRLPCGRLLP